MLYVITKFSVEEYKAETWFDYSCIGRKIGEKRVTRKQYIEAEKAYLSAVLRLLEYTNITRLRVDSGKLERYGINRLLRSRKKPIVLKTQDDIRRFAKGVIRHTYWAPLYTKELKIYFGYDMFMYVKCSIPEQEMHRLIKRCRLHVSRVPSNILNIPWN